MDDPVAEWEAYLATKGVSLDDRDLTKRRDVDWARLERGAPFRFYVRCAKQSQLGKAIAESEEEPKGLMPIAVHRDAAHGWIVTMRADDWLSIVTGEMLDRMAARLKRVTVWLNQWFNHPKTPAQLTFAISDIEDALFPLRDARWPDPDDSKQASPNTAAGGGGDHASGGGQL